jgi:hypothetical protein
MHGPPAPLVKALPATPWPLVAAPTCITFELPPEELRLLQAADAIRLGGRDAVTQRDASKPRVDSSLLPRRHGLAPPLAIGIMVRNAGAFLLDNFKELHAGILSRSVDWRVFYVENDSCDDTREILHSLEALYPGKVVGDQLALRKVDSVHMCPRRYSNCPTRIRMLAWLRQRVLDRALAWPDAQLYINVDMDYDPFDFRADHFWQMYTNVMLPCRRRLPHEQVLAALFPLQRAFRLRHLRLRRRHSSQAPEQLPAAAKVSHCAGDLVAQRLPDVSPRVAPGIQCQLRGGPPRGSLRSVRGQSARPLGLGNH